jgi:hypothetical protein
LISKHSFFNFYRHIIITYSRIKKKLGLAIWDLEIKSLVRIIGLENKRFWGFIDKLIELTNVSELKYFEYFELRIANA